MRKPLSDIVKLYCEGLAPRERWSPSQWAERAPRIIPDNGVNPEPGPMRMDRTPYLREIVDTLVAAGTEIVVFVKSTQVGYTTLLEMMPGYWADLDPGACMIVEPDEVSAKSMLTNRVLPTILATPCLARHLGDRAWDKKQDWLKLDSMPIITAWAGSPMRVASWSIRYILFDEVDKYPRFAGNEGDPIMLGLKRVSNWRHRSRAMIGSTPTIREGNVWRWWEACGDRRHFWLPCPHCCEYQTLMWSQCKWPKVEESDDRARKADRIVADQSAWYECERCNGRIEDRHKPNMLRRGVWAGEDQVVGVDGQIKGPHRKSGRIGFHLNSLYSPWLTFSTLASEYLLAIGDPARMMDFRNSRLAEPFEEQTSKISVNNLESKIEAAQSNNWRGGVAPKWTGVVILTVDTQKDHFWAVARAWGHGFRSRLLLFERLESFDQIESLLRASIPVDGGGSIPPQICLIDSGGTADPETGASRTAAVYQFSLRNPAQIIPTKGASQRQVNPIRHTTVTPKPKDGTRIPPIQLCVLNTSWYKDILSSRIQDKSSIWELTSEANKHEYMRQMTSEHKIFDRKRNEYRWIPISMGAPNHAWDCEAMQCAGADLVGVNTIPEDHQYTPPISRVVQNNDSSREKSSWASSHKGKY